MAKKVKKYVYNLEKSIYLISTSTIVGKKEGEGPISKYFDTVAVDDTFGQESYEKAERRMMEEAIFSCIQNAGKEESDVDLIIGGDLLNQLVTTSYSARKFNVPFIGVYAACSTMSESYAIGSMLLESGGFNNILCVTSSHFSTSERQFRTPLELGAQRQTYSQWTVTGSGCGMLSTSGIGPKITKVCFGKVTDYGVKDIANMGAAMAPAAYSTLTTFLDETNTSPNDYDLIVTGDLGKLGSDILRDLMKKHGMPLGQNYTDCGHMIYSSEQKTFQGGSGAGCSASVFNSYIYDKLKNKEFKKVIFMATGALMSTTTNQQGDSIPAISHLVMFEA